MLADRSKRAMLHSHDALRKHVDELREAKAAADQAVLAKGRFLAAMSHELRTPLNGIVGSADLLMCENLSMAQQELVRVLQRSGHSLLAIVNDVLDYSRLEAGAMMVESIAFDLREVVQDVVSLEAGVAAERGLTLRSSLHVDLPAIVAGDPTRLRQVLLNLVGNALKFTAEGSVDISVAPAGAEGMVQFAVADSGVGIPEDVLPTLFSAFVQADASTTRRFGGTGLGLAISAQLVERMHGVMDVHSEVGLGSTFSFTCRLPATSAEVTVPAAGGDVETFAQRRVLVVDDQAANRLLVGKMLGRLGCEVREATNGAEAVRIVAEDSFDLVLMDVSMPVMNGHDASRAIRQLGCGSEVPIVALTANAMPEDRQLCREAGMSGYLSKPVRLADLTRELGRLLSAG
ncbi:MAG: ATP-binding protein [Planctomycetota bacterium]